MPTELKTGFGDKCTSHLTCGMQKNVPLGTIIPNGRTSRTRLSGFDAPSVDTKWMKSDFAVGADVGQTSFSTFNSSSTFSRHDCVGNRRVCGRLSILSEEEIDEATAAASAKSVSIDQETASSASLETCESDASWRDDDISSNVSAPSRVKIHVCAERLSRDSPSGEKLLLGRRKKAFTFHDDSNDDGFVFGSREGECCLLRIRVESPHDDEVVPVANITDVQMLYRTGRSRNLEVLETVNCPFCKETVVLLEPAALQLVGKPCVSEKNVNTTQDLMFQLHIRVEVMDSDGCEDDIVKTFYWRTLCPKKRATALSCFKECSLKTWNRATRFLRKSESSASVENNDRTAVQTRKRWGWKKSKVPVVPAKLSWEHTLNPRPTTN